jgi:hypothetical protein
MTVSSPRSRSSAQTKGRPKKGRPQCFSLETLLLIHLKQHLGSAIELHVFAG